MATPVTNCSNCATTLGPTTRFCPGCGAPQTEELREERRVVTVVFGDLSGFVEMSENRDAEEVKAIVDDIFAKMSEIITSFGGRVDKIIGDEIMAVFGAPSSHEDDAERAVRAALAMRRSLSERSAQTDLPAIQMHIGVNTGEVVAGFVGGSGSYTVMGDVVNTARRIEDKASEGQILVGRATAEASAGAIEYSRAGTVTAKGKRAPIDVWEAISERGLPGERAPHHLPLIGRDEELSLLDVLADITKRDRRPHLATLIGEAGLGKSRVAAEFSARSGLRGRRVLHGRSLPYGTMSPAFALEEVLRTALLAGATDPDEIRGTLKDQMAAMGVPAEADRIASFLGAGPATTHPKALLDSAVVVLEAVAAASGLLIMTLHEMHWAEDAVLDVVQQLMTRGRAPILIVGLARPELLERRPDWGAIIGSSVLELRPLDRERSAQILEVLAPGLAHPLRERIIDRAGGNPFFLEELARMLADKPDAEIKVPGSVHALVAARLDGLAGPVKRFLQNAAVVGERFWPPALEALGVDVDAGLLTTPDVAELVEAAGDGSYRFRQTIVREVAYGSVPKQQRARQHEQVGRWLEQIGSVEDDLIAHHYERSAALAREVGVRAPDADAKAREYLVRSGDRALAMDAAASAASFYQRAAVFPLDELDKADLLVRLSEALIGSWRQALARPHLKDALETARRLGARDVEGRALRLLGDAYRMAGERLEAVEPLAQALEIARELGDGHGEAEALRSHGLLELEQGRWLAAVPWFEQSLELWRAQADLRGQGWSLQNLGWASLLLGRLEDAYAYLMEGEDVFTQIGDREGVGWCRGLLGWVLLIRGDVVEAARIAEELEHNLVVEHPEYVENAGFALELQRILRAYIAVLRGCLVEARSLAAEAIEAVDWREAGWAQALGRFPVFMAAIMSGSLIEAQEQLDLGRDAAGLVADPFYVGGFAFGNALLALEQGDTERASVALDALIADEQIGPLWAGAAGVRWLRARILRAQGRIDEAIDHLRERLGVSSIGLITTARSRAQLSLLLTHRGDIAEAIAEARGAMESSHEEVIGHAVSLRALAVALIADGALAEAEDVARLEVALLEDSDWDIERVRAYSTLARVLDQRRRHDEASEAFDRAQELIAALPAGAISDDLESQLRD